MRRELNVLALNKGVERYVYIYEDDGRQALIDALREQASDPGLSFTWFDAAVLGDKVREQQSRTANPSSPSQSRIE